MTAAAVQLWLAHVPAYADREITLAQLLGADEIARARRFHFAIDRTRYVISHAVLRVLVSRALDVVPAAVHFGAGPFGKPYIYEVDTTGTPEPRVSDLQFSLSHSGDWVALAFRRGGVVGVDIEQWSDVEYDVLSEQFFSVAERQALQRLSVAQKTAGFFACWTRKEAYIKATGLGVSQGLDYFDVTLSPDVSPRLIEDRRTGHTSRDWTMSTFDTPAGYSGALVIEGASEPVDQRVLTPKELFELR